MDSVANPPVAEVEESSFPYGTIKIPPHAPAQVPLLAPFPDADEEILDNVFCNFWHKHVALSVATKPGVVGVIQCLQRRDVAFPDPSYPERFGDRARSILSGRQARAAVGVLFVMTAS
jgi:hypothetical protein